MWSGRGTQRGLALPAEARDGPHRAELVRSTHVKRVRPPASLLRERREQDLLSGGSGRVLTIQNHDTEASSRLCRDMALS
jgi:hypothetical protein